MATRPTTVDPKANRGDLEFYKFCRLPSGEWAVRICGDNTGPIPVTFLQSPTTPAIINTTSPATPDTEFSHTFPNDTVKFRIKAKGLAKFSVSYSASGPVETYGIGGILEENNINLQGVTIYIKCNKASKVFEITQWTV